MITQSRPPAQKEATIDDLYAVDGKAELVNGRIVTEMPTGDEPGYAAAEIFVSIREYARRVKRGKGVSDKSGFVVNLPNRKSFSPDAAYYTGLPGGHGFYPDPPEFAAEVRSENDYSPRAERAMEQKRADYFAAGTKVVWDVALLHDDVVRVYRNGVADVPAAIYKRGEIAEAEPAVPGWTIPVDDLFE